MLVPRPGLYLLGIQSVSSGGHPTSPATPNAPARWSKSGDWVVPRFPRPAPPRKTPLHLLGARPPPCHSSATTPSCASPSTLATVGTALMLGLMVRRFAALPAALDRPDLLHGRPDHRRLQNVPHRLRPALPVPALMGQSCLAILWHSHRCVRPQYGSPIIFWSSLGLAGLTKGPLPVGIQFMTILFLTLLEVNGRWSSGAIWADARWLKWTRPLIGLPLLPLSRPGSSWCITAPTDFSFKVAHRALNTPAPAWDGHASLPMISTASIPPHLLPALSPADGPRPCCNTAAFPPSNLPSPPPSAPGC